MNLQSRVPIILQLGFREEAIPRLKSYAELLWTENVDLNLFSRKMTWEELIDNHIIDSLLPLSHFPKSLHAVADFGSGGGLPAVIYALQFPKTTFHLFEKSVRKREFLDKCKKLAPNLKLHGEIPPQLEDIELITARAFKPLDVILELSRNYYLQGGRYFLLKARREKIDEEISFAQKKFKNLKVRIVPLTSPVLQVERHLVIIEGTSALS